MDNVFVLDAHMMDVRAFSPNGELVFRKEFVKGEGPGELVGPVNLALSGDERFFYIFDQDRWMISVYSKEMDFVRSFEAQTNYAYMTDGPDGGVLTSFNQMDIGDRPLLRLFDEGGRQVGAFGGKQASYEENRSNNLQLFYLTYIVRQANKTYLSYGYPYDLHVFDENNVLIQRIERKPDYFGRTYTKGRFTHPTGVVASLIGARNSLLLHLLMDRENEITYVEALDEIGRSRGTTKLGDHEDDWGYYLYSFPDAVTSDDRVYIVAQTPFPRLVSFRIIRE